MCRKASEVFVENIPADMSLNPFRFVETSGNGYDLPNGCVVELVKMMPPKPYQPKIPRFMYWNANGTAISNDPSFRTVCYNPQKAKDGINVFFCKIIDFQNYDIIS